MSIANLLVRAGRTHGERPALYAGTRLLVDYRTLAQRAASLAMGLADQHRLRPGDRVALIMRNCPAYVESLFACWHAGFAAVPVNAKLHPREFAYILGDSETRVCLTSPDLANTLASLQPSLPDLRAVISVEDRDYDRMLESEPAKAADCNPDDLAWLFYTSGTTGQPKGAMLSHRNLLAMTMSYFVDVDQIAPEDCILHPAPMSHGSGMYILPHVAAAAAQVIPDSGGFDPPEIFHLLKAHPGAAFFAAPTMVSRLVDSPEAGRADTTNLKTIVYGGGPMYTSDCKRALKLFGNTLVQIYGQGESPMTITALSKARHAETDHPRYEARLASVGTPHTVVDVAVADAAGRFLPPGETGEVLVRGDSVMLGYWRNKSASAEALCNGWLHTGDVGEFDADGFLTLKDRSKDLIISGGSNIYPREVEEVLSRHPTIGEVSVVGKPDREWGEVIVAFVVLAGEAPIDTAALDAFCLDHLARFKRPKCYVVVDDLPKNNYGKVLKTELRERLEPATGERK